MIHQRRLLSFVILACSIHQQADAFTDVGGLGGGFGRTVLGVENRGSSPLTIPSSAPAQGRRRALVLEERQLRQRIRPLFGKNSEKLDETEQGELELETVYIDTSQEEVPEDVQAELVDSQPSEWAIMKEVRNCYHGRGERTREQIRIPCTIHSNYSTFTFTKLLGINVFTYILAITIAFFFSMNALLGPGWLGNTIGLPGTGTFTEKSESLPDTFDLSDSEYLL